MDCYAGLVLSNITPNCVFKFEFTFRGSEVFARTARKQPDIGLAFVAFRQISQRVRSWALRSVSMHFSKPICSTSDSGG
jgi:hypothetical protein